LNDINPVPLLLSVLHAVYEWMHIDYQMGPYRFNFWEVFIFVIVASVVFWAVARFMDVDDD
jgi:hypothetical protein